MACITSNMLPLQCRASSSAANASLRIVTPRFTTSSRQCVLQRRYNSNFQPNRPPLYGKEADKAQTGQTPPGQEKKAPLGSRLAHAWRSTPTKWYPIPIALGALVLVGVQYRKQLREGGMKVQQQGVDGAVVDVKGGGPWQVQVLGALPLRSLSRLWGYLNGLVLPVWFRPFGFKLYANIFGCNLEEVEYDDLTHYESLGEFFYRRLKEGSRKIDDNAAVVSPADGRVLHFGEIAGEQVEQVKGMTYSLEALLGVEGKSAEDPLHVEFDQKHVEGRHVNDEDFANINDIQYSLSSLLGTSKKLTRVQEEELASNPSKHPRPARDPREPRDAARPDPKTDSLMHDASVAAELGTSAVSTVTGPLGSEGGAETGADGKVSKPTELPLMNKGNKLYFLVVYLAPGDYHRFHSPAPWVVERRRHFTGDLFSVSPYIANRLKDLFVLNERVALLGRWKHGFFSMVPVGATNVGSIKINFDEALRTNSPYPTHPPHTYTEAIYASASKLLRGQPLLAGEEMGGFKLGSTIVLVFEAPPNFHFEVKAGDKVKVGEALGVLKP